MIRTFTSMVLFLMTFVVYGQVNTRSIQPKSTQTTANSGVSRALIIGVSDYEDNQIPDLQYAHKDAEALATFLQSAEGGSVPKQNMIVLLNEQATKANIQAALDQLVRRTRKGDQVVIYFSGHGDVETITKQQDGYLLTYDTPPNNYIAGAFKVSWMQEIIKKLSVEKEAQVVMISDACRSGNLAGNVNGASATSAVLAQQFANEVKILSCQPDELSVEGEQWGGGRGCFSYHLIEGLKGQADKNEDASINLFEIEQYLENIVPQEAAPHSQIPFTNGNKKAQLLKVTQPNFRKSRGGSNTIKSEIDIVLDGIAPNIQEQYTNFKKAIETNKLITPKGQSAEYYFNQLIRAKELQPVFDKITNQYTSALQNEAQQYINLMLKGDPALIDDYVYKRNKNVKLFPEYLAKSAEFLGEKHYMYSNLKMKEYFFRGVALRDSLLTTIQDEITSLELNLQASNQYHKALEMDSTAAFVHLALANISMDQNDFQKSIIYVDKAIELAPTWALAQATKGQIFSRSNKKQKAVEYYQKALELDAKQVYIMQWLENDYQQMGNLEQANHWNQQQIQTIKDQYAKNPFNAPDYYKGMLAMALSENGKYKEAEKLYQKVALQTQEKDSQLLHARAINFFRQNEYKQALTWNSKALALSETPEFWSTQALIQLELHELKNAKKAIQKAKKQKPVTPKTNWVEGVYFERVEKTKKATESYRTAFELEPNNISYLKSFIQLKQKEQQNEAQVDEVFEWVNQLNPDQPEILKSFALWYRKIGVNDKARDFIKSSLALKNKLE